jgi:catechol 2,3-dioxygenase-like lactoylglutathione lyase family enzyme
MTKERQSCWAERIAQENAVATILRMGRARGERYTDPQHSSRGETMSGINVSQIDHVSVLITDLARSRRFYRDLLGLKEIAKPRTFDFSVLWFEMGSTTLHLLLKPQADPPSPRHFALRVVDVNAARTYCQQQGIETLETTPIPYCNRFFVFDPDGNRIEVIQWLKPYEPAISGAAKLDGAG